MPGQRDDIVISPGAERAPVLTSMEMRAWERTTIDAGVSVAELMDRAATCVATMVRIDPLCIDPILVLAGPGNNGGDALLAGSKLAQSGRSVSAVLWRRSLPSSGALTDVYPTLGTSEDGIRSVVKTLGGAGTVIDGLLGTGRSRPATGDLLALLSALRARQAMPSPPRVVAVDVPSGMDADDGSCDPQSVQADVTVSLGALKAGSLMYPAAARVGRLEFGDIGLPADAVPLSGRLITRPLVGSLLPRRPLDAHKGIFGRTLVVGGSSRHTGAPSLTVTAALRAGSGLATLAIPEGIQGIVASKLTENSFLPLPEAGGAFAAAAVQPLEHAMSTFDALAIGPGIGFLPEARQVAVSLLAYIATIDDPPSVVIDADALNALASTSTWWTRVPRYSVLTPHPAEMARLAGASVEDVQADRVGVARRSAEAWTQVVVLKGAHTIVAHPDGRWWLLPVANPALATGGTGDVLCGTIAGLCAQGLETWQAAVCGVWVHAEAARTVAAGMEAGMLAGDLLAALPVALARARG